MIEKSGHRRSIWRSSRTDRTEFPRALQVGFILVEEGAARKHAPQLDARHK